MSQPSPIAELIERTASQVRETFLKRVGALEASGRFPTLHIIDTELRYVPGIGFTDSPKFCMRQAGIIVRNNYQTGFQQSAHLLLTPDGLCLTDGLILTKLHPIRDHWVSLTTHKQLKLTPVNDSSVWLKYGGVIEQRLMELETQPSEHSAFTS